MVVLLESIEEHRRPLLKPTYKVDLRTRNAKQKHHQPYTLLTIMHSLFLKVRHRHISSFPKGNTVA